MIRLIPDDAPTPGTIFIIDDDGVTNQVAIEVAHLLGLTVEWYANGESFFEHYDPQRASCLILEVHMSVTCGLNQHRDAKSHRWPPIIFITTDIPVPLVFEALGTHGCPLLRKPLDRDSLSDPIREAIALDRERQRAHALADDLLKRIGTLTKRESQIMKLLASGESSKQIAHLLSISPKTVENHRAMILEKMAADNPTQLSCMLAHMEECESW